MQPVELVMGAAEVHLKATQPGLHDVAVLYPGDEALWPAQARASVNVVPNLPSNAAKPPPSEASEPRPRRFVPTASGIVQA